MKPKAFSAPGKALLAGGYLVLDPSYKSYVVALSSRMHAVVSGCELEGTTESSITVRSSQFTNGLWKYKIHDHISFGSNRNPFLEAIISIVFAYFAPTTPFNIEIAVFSDRGYHTNLVTTSRTSENGKKLFLYHEDEIHKVAKTGLGSSAGLVTTVTTALCSFFSGNEVDLNVINNLAQIAHCCAQGKIGSGFDVAAAVYGSIVYRRFYKSLIEGFLSYPQEQQQLTSEQRKHFQTQLQKVVNSNWEFLHVPCSMPPRIRLLMGDIKGGSETPKLVSKIMAWKQDKTEESETLYKNLDSANQELIESMSLLNSLHQLDPETYNSGIDYFKEKSILELDTNDKLKHLRPFVSLINALTVIRVNLKKLTVLSGADVEPEEQTTLLDSCKSLKGCLGGVVPGAGGYDAICLIVIEDSIESLLATTKNDLRFSDVNWLDLHEESQGLKEENPNDYTSLL